MPVQSVIPHNLAMPINQLEGIQTDIPRIIALSPAASVADYENRLKRLEGVRRARRSDHRVDARRHGARTHAATGRDPRRAVAGGSAARREPDGEPDAVGVRRLSGRDRPVDRDRLSTQAAALFTSHVKPAFARLHEFLVSTYLPACRETIGADALPNGAAMYAYNVRWHTTTSLTPKEIHEIGLSEVKRIRALMDEVMAQVKFTGGFEAFKKHLRTSPSSSIGIPRRS